MFSSFQSFVTGSVVREKLYKGFHKISLSKALDICEIKVMFLLTNSLNNKSIFFALLLLLEKITLSSFSFVITKKSIANFNIKKQLKLGALYTITGAKKDQFLRLFIPYSLKKLDSNIFFHSFNYIKYSCGEHIIAFGIQKILFNVLFSINQADYELFAPLFENMVYGVHIYFYTHFRNFFINRLLISQYGILIL